MKKILIVDDSIVVRKNLTKLLNTVSGVNVVGEAANSPEFIEQFEKCKPDIVILDISLTIGNGIEILSFIKNVSPSTIVIMFTNFANDAFRTTTTKIGADYFLDKTKDIEILLEILSDLTLQT